MRIRGAAAVGAALGAMFLLLAPAASADTLVPPSVYVRPIGDLSEPKGPWQSLGAQLSSLGPYQIGVGMQPTTDISNRQAVQVDLAAMPGGAPPSFWLNYPPYTPYCGLVVGDAGSIQETGATLFFHGNGVYTVNVSVFTTAQWNARAANTCSGGQTSSVSLTVSESGAVKVLGPPVVPRTTLDAKGFAGIELIAPQGAAGDQWRCARDPVRTMDGPVTGSAVTSSPEQEKTSLRDKLSEEVAFTGPGRWACSVQMFGGDSAGNVFGTPWTTTPTFVVKGQYLRDARRTVLTRLPRGRVRLTVPADRQVGSAAAGGRLSLTLYRAGCRRGHVVLHRTLVSRSVVDTRGVARLRFRAPTRPAFYLGRPGFGGNALVLAGPDVDMSMEVRFDPGHPSRAPAFGFVDPRVWVPC